MQETSSLYKRLLADPGHWKEYTLVIGESGVLVTNQGDRITFGSKPYSAEVRGSVIQLEGTTENPLTGLTIFGKTTQKTTTGKNLLQNTAKTVTQNGVTFTVNDDGSVTMNGTALDTVSAFCTINNSTMQLTEGVRYTLSGCPKHTGVAMFAGQYGNDSGSGYTFTAHTTASSGLSPQIYIRVSRGTTVNNVVVKPMLRLASVSDATYEPYTGGIPAPNPDYPQTLDSVGADGSVNVTVSGKNLFDESKIKNITSTGRYAEFVNGRIHFVNNDAVGYVATASLTLTPGTYYLGSSIQTVTGVPTVGYKINSNPSTYATNTFVTLTETSRFELRATTSGTNTSGEYYANFWITAGESATSYEPYKETQTLSISTPNGLPGIPVSSGGNYTDANGQRWVCDEVDFEKGVYVQRIYSTVFKNSTGWTVDVSSGGGKRFVNSGFKSISLKLPADSTKTANGLCSGFPVVNGNTTWGRTMGLAVEHTGWLTLYYDGIEQTAEALGNYFASHPTTFIAELATPIETALSAEQLAAFAALHTNYPNTTIFNDGGADMIVGYLLNGEGPINILVASSGADSGFRESSIISMSTQKSIFSDSNPSVGNCIAGQITAEMMKPTGEIPRRARLAPYVRLTNGIEHSEWIPKGVFFIDHREYSGDENERMVINGYDHIILTEDEFPSSTHTWPRKDIDVVRDIANEIGTSIDGRTVQIMNKGYKVNYPAGYSMRETLENIAAMYAGSFIMSDTGELLLVTMFGIPKETSYLIDNVGFAVTFGGDRILV